MGIFVTDSTKENQNIEMLRQLYQPAMQNGASLKDIASIMVSDNLTDIKSKLTKIEKERQDREDQVNKSNQEASVQASQIAAEVENKKMQLEQAKMEMEMEKAALAAETSIQVAMINAGSKEKVESGKMMLNEEDLMVKKSQLSETQRSNKAKESLTLKSIQSKNNNNTTK